MPTTNLQLPHLVSFCQVFELRTNRHCRVVTATSKKWARESKFLDEEQRRAVPGLQLGLLASLCYPTCDVAQLSLITEFLILVVHWIDRTTASAETAFEHMWARLSRTMSAAWLKRFQRHLSTFRSARALTTEDVESGVVPDSESYIPLRRDASAVKMCFDLIEYAEDLKIPDGVYSMPVFRKLRHDACNVVAWSCDIAAFARKHATSDKHNLVSILMEERRLSMQSAMHAAGALVRQTVGNFLANERTLLSESLGYGEKVDADVRRYVLGLQDWIVGSIHWLYETDRFFGDIGDEVRELGWVFLSHS